MHLNPMKDVKWIVVHCSATKLSRKVTVKDLDNWHREKGWPCCGYHWVIYQDGSIHPGRAEQFAGAHVVGYNQHAIGVCYIGGKDAHGRNTDTRTPEQKASLWYLLKELKQAYPDAKIVGHNFLNRAKDCPCFDAQKEYATLNSNLKIVN